MNPFLLTDLCDLEEVMAINGFRKATPLRLSHGETTRSTRTTSRIPILLMLMLLGSITPRCYGFSKVPMKSAFIQQSSSLRKTTYLKQTTDVTNEESDMPIARRITVTGDVGGYYRACVINEVSQIKHYRHSSNLVFTPGLKISEIGWHHVAPRRRFES